MKQRKLLLSIMVVGMFSSAAFALSPMGPPVAGLPQGQYNCGFGYAFSEMDLEVSGPLGGLGADAELDNVQSNIYYGSVGYGISDDWNIYGAIGAADAEFDGENGVTFDGDADFCFAVGTKRTLAESADGKTKWGALLQYGWGETDDTPTAASIATFGNGAISLPSTRPQMEFKWYELQLALGPVHQVSDDVSVYGGPFLHFVEGDLKIKGSQYEYELEQLWEFGGFLGVAINLGDATQNAALTIEVLATAEAVGAGIGAIFNLP